MPSDVLVIIDTSAGQARETALELLGPAREIADGGQVSAVVIGSGVEAVAGDVAGRGVDRALYVDAPALERYTTDGYTKAIEADIGAVDPKVVLFPGTTAGRDLGPYVAARAGAACLSDCVKLRWEDGGLVGTRPVYQGKMLTDVRVQSGERSYAVMRGGVAAPPEASGSGSAEPLAVEIGDSDLRVKLKDVAEKPAGGANLEGAETVVVGGRGLGSAEAFSMIVELAAALDAPVGATRAVTDLGWRPHYEQIGQTGKTVRPKLYIGAGVSGAVQHTVGMQGSETVVVINRDPDAPILKLATIGVIGDLNAILPALTAEIRAARGRS
ncbi:MAG: electron transfer flavoprotein subunit alpha/FixB family protein [Thermomicrobiales bacterium]